MKRNVGGLVVLFIFLVVLVSGVYAQDPGPTRIDMSLTEWGAWTAPVPDGAQWVQTSERVNKYIGHVYTFETQNGSERGRIFYPSWSYHKRPVLTGWVVERAGRMLKVMVTPMMTPRWIFATLVVEIDAPEGVYTNNHWGCVVENTEAVCVAPPVAEAQYRYHTMARGWISVYGYADEVDGAAVWRKTGYGPFTFTLGPEEILAKADEISQ